MSASQKTSVLEVRDLKVSVEDKNIVQGLSLKIQPGEVHALMGRNGSGKSSLSFALMGHPKYQIDGGKVFLDGEEITDLPPDQRAQRGLFLAFQYPVSIPGVTVANFLRSSMRAIRGQEIPAKDIRKMIQSEAKALQVPASFLTRSLNEGFSGGEKKKLETLQMRLLQPKVAILDETDSGLDIDALKLISKKIEDLRDGKRGILVITHYQRMLNYIRPDHVHVLHAGQIVRSGGADLALELESRGYDWILPAGKGSTEPAGDAAR